LALETPRSYVTEVLADSERIRTAEPIQRATAFRLRWSAAARAALALGVLFIAVTCYWLGKDRSVPVDDAALHLNFAIEAYESLRSGHVLHALTDSLPYPPLTHLVGALGIFVGGVGVAPPIIAENIVFVLLLVLGCYKVGSLAFDRRAGLLAVVFALGSPLIIEQFHEFMLDAPEAAMVAVAVWAILATERFSRPKVSALAGIAVGLGMLSKETFVFFVAGVALVTAIRGGRHAWRGMTIFAAVALVIALPWYLYEASTIRSLVGGAFGSMNPLLANVAPPRLSAANFEWYFWSILNWQLYVPLFGFFVVGWVWTFVGFVRRHPVSRFAPELACGAFTSWLAITETYLHDPRYSVPMVVYLAVFGAGWLTLLPRRAGTAMATVLVLAALANSLGVGFGAGTVVVAGSGATSYEQQGRLTFYRNSGIWVGAPSRDGDVLGLLRTLRRSGVREVSLYEGREGGVDLSPQGVAVLARIAGLGRAGSASIPTELVTAPHDEAFLRRGVPEPGFPAPCVKLKDGPGVWIRLGGSHGRAAWSYCPFHG
jgi:Dolichyl-phosphate-mannose-protein mannosyltransferase